MTVKEYSKIKKSEFNVETALARYNHYMRQFETFRSLYSNEKAVSYMYQYGYMEELRKAAFLLSVAYKKQTRVGGITRMK